MLIHQHQRNLHHIYTSVSTLRSSIRGSTPAVCHSNFGQIRPKPRAPGSPGQKGLHCHLDRRHTSAVPALWPSPSCFTCQGFLQSGWSDHVAYLPSVHVGIILDYLQHRQLSTESKGAEPHLNATVTITQKPLNRGYQFFYWSYVHNMHVAAPSPAPGSPSQYFVKAECWASQKKSSKYNQKLLLTATVEEYGVKVEHAHCTCPAGIAGGFQRCQLLACSPWRSANKRTPPQAFLHKSHAHLFNMLGAHISVA